MKTTEELLAILDDWFASETGTCSCSQVHGEATYREAGLAIRSMPPKEQNAILSAFVRKWVEEKYLLQGYTWEDAKAACEFIEETVLSDS